MNKVVINGITVASGEGYSSICVNNGRVIINGRDVTPDAIEIKVEAIGTIKSINMDSGNIVVSGNVGELKSTSGNVKCGDVSGNVSTTSGGVSCKNVEGSVQTVSGNIECGRIQGNVRSYSGNINES